MVDALKDEDEGSFGRRLESLRALLPEQIRMARARDGDHAHNRKTSWPRVRQL